MNTIDGNVTVDALMTLGETIFGHLKVSEDDIRDFTERMKLSFPEAAPAVTRECFDQLVETMVYHDGNVSFRKMGCDDPTTWLHGDLIHTQGIDLLRTKVATSDDEMSVVFDMDDVDELIHHLQHIRSYMKFRENRV